jgi:Leucine-rich repeat (LRR) protein
MTLAYLYVGIRKPLPLPSVAESLRKYATQEEINELSPFLYSYSIKLTILSCLRADDPEYLLDLSNLGLDLIPKILKKCKFKSLRMDGNKIRELPDWISEHDTIKELRLRSNDIRDIRSSSSSRSLFLPAWVFTKLEKIDFSRSLITLPRNVMLEESKIKEIVFNRCGISSTYNWLFELPNLEILDMRDNQILRLPEEVENCHIRELLLSNNSLFVVPLWVFASQDLEIADFERNNIQAFPPNLFDSNFRSVNFQYNRLSSEYIASVDNQIRRCGGTIRYSIFQVPDDLDNSDGSIILIELFTLAGYSDNRARELIASIQLEDNEEEELNNFLGRIKSSLIFSSTKKQETSKNLVKWLLHTKKDKNFRIFFFGLCDSGAISCGDRISIYYDKLYEAYHIYTNGEELSISFPDFLIGLMKKKRLEEIASAANGHDQIEDTLHLILEGKSILNLPTILDNMLYNRYSIYRDKPDEVEKILTEVDTEFTSLTTDQKAALLSKNDSWAEYIKQQKKAFFDKELEDYENEHPLPTSEAGMKDWDYVQLCNSWKQKRDDQATAIIKKLTLPYLELKEENHTVEHFSDDESESKRDS